MHILEGETAHVILEQEHRLLHPTMRSLPTELSALLADEFREFGSSARVYTKQQALQSVSVHSTARYELREFRAVELHAGVVLAMYHVTRFGLEGIYPDVTRRNSIWVKHTGQQQMLFNLGTIKQD